MAIQKRATYGHWGAGLTARHQPRELRREYYNRGRAELQAAGLAETYRYRFQHGDKVQEAEAKAKAEDQAARMRVATKHDIEVYEGMFI